MRSSETHPWVSPPFQISGYRPVDNYQVAFFTILIGCYLLLMVVVGIGSLFFNNRKFDTQSITKEFEGWRETDLTGTF